MTDDDQQVLAFENEGGRSGAAGRLERWGCWCRMWMKAQYEVDDRIYFYKDGTVWFSEMLSVAAMCSGERSLD